MRFDVGARNISKRSFCRGGFARGARARGIARPVQKRGSTAANKLRTIGVDAPCATGVTQLMIDLSGAERTKRSFVADARAVASGVDKKDSGFCHRGDAKEY